MKFGILKKRSPEHVARKLDDNVVNFVRAPFDVVFLIGPPEMGDVASQERQIARFKRFGTVSYKTGPGAVNDLKNFIFGMKMPRVGKMRHFLPFDFYRRP